MRFPSIIKLLKKPSEFFEETDERSLNPSWMFVSLAALLAMIVSFYVEIPLLLKTELPQLAILLSAISFVWRVPIALFMPFLRGGLSHLGLRLIGGKGVFRDTFKVTSYGWSVMYIYTIVAAIIVVPAYIGDLESVGGIFVQIVAIILSFAGLVHSFIVQATGAARFHGITRFRAFFGLIIIPAFIVFMIVMIVLTVFLGLTLLLVLPLI